MIYFFITVLKGYHRASYKGKYWAVSDRYNQRYTFNFTKGIKLDMQRYRTILIE